MSDLEKRLESLEIRVYDNPPKTILEMISELGNDELIIIFEDALMDKIQQG